MQALENRVSNLEELMTGKIREGKKVDGVMDILKRIGATLYGDEEAGTEGVVQAMNRLTNAMKWGAGVIAGIQVAWIVYKEIHK